MELNFGDEQFKFDPSNGYIGVSTAPNDCTQNSPNNAMASSPKTPNRPDNAPMCVIIEPTKELAEQTYEQIASFIKFLDAPIIR